MTVVADRDATLIEDPAGALANGTGPLFVGRTNQAEQSRRRAVIHFDLRASVPPGAVIDSVELDLQLQPSNPGGPVTLFRVLDDWSEGPTFSGGGGGRPSQPGDATWIHRNFPLELWGRPGGWFVPRASAVGTDSGSTSVSWTNPRHMLEDVRMWLHAPSRNFGWLLVGNEALPQTSQAFSSREDPDPDKRPRLTIRYRRPGR